MPLALLSLAVALLHAAASSEVCGAGGVCHTVSKDHEMLQKGIQARHFKVSKSKVKGSCVRQTDCSVSEWCKDPSYDAWCAAQGASGTCPAPQCTSGSTEGSTAAPTTAAPTTSAPSPAPTPSGSGCSAKPGNNGGGTDENCAQCANGYQWWPCNADLCDCGVSPTPSTTAAPTPTTAAPTPTTAAPTTAAPTTAAPTTAGPTTVAPSTAAPTPGGTVNVCYFTNWARYRHGLINIQQDVFEMGLDGNLCTHFMYGFAKVDTSFGIMSNDPNADHPSGHLAQDGLCNEVCNDPNFTADWNDPNGERCEWPCSPTRVMRGYEAMNVGMKRKNPSIKTLISVGGWNFNDCAASPEATVGQGSATCEIFSTIAKSEANIKIFSANVIAFCRKWGFDGFDLDWEYPVVAGHNNNDKVNGEYQDETTDYQDYITMLRVMKEEFNKENPSSPLLLTAAVGVGKHTTDTAYDIPAMNKYLDLINLMTYDMHGSWESRTGCNANLYATDEDAAYGGGVGAGEAVEGYPLSVSWAVEYWMEKGASADKLTMGVGTYGRGWKLQDPSQNGYNAPANGACEAGESTGEPGYRSYYEVLELLKSGKATRHYDTDRQCPYVVTEDGEWIGYDDEESMRAKVAYMKSKGLRGSMVWALDLDDFAGAYSNGVKYPLIKILRE